MKRIEALREAAFEKKGFDGFLVTNESNLLYFAGFLGAASLLVPKKGESIIYVYGVNYEQAKAEGAGFRVELVKQGENLPDKIASHVKTSKIRKLAVDSLTYEQYRLLARALRGNARLKVQTDIVGKLRRVKDENELKLMRKAGELTVEGMKAAYEIIKPGMTEIQIAAEIEYAMRRKGSWGTAFDTIVASGARSAFPHGGCIERTVQNGDLVVVDIGATYHHYRSDITRTLVAGKPSRKQEKLYDIVKSAHEKAFQAMKPKAKASAVDAAARKVIVDAGYAEYFVHGLGHGVGLEVHELPRLGLGSKVRLMIGDVVTDEPGIYLVGFGGVRIEDTVLVRERKAEKFTDGLYALTSKE